MREGSTENAAVATVSLGSRRAHREPRTSVVRRELLTRLRRLSQGKDRDSRIGVEVIKRNRSATRLAVDPEHVLRVLELRGDAIATLDAFDKLPHGGIVPDGLFPGKKIDI